LAKHFFEGLVKGGLIGPYLYRTPQDAWMAFRFSHPRKLDTAPAWEKYD
jgi:hypothetical protein